MIYLLQGSMYMNPVQIWLKRVSRSKKKTQRVQFSVIKLNCISFLRFMSLNTIMKSTVKLSLFHAACVKSASDLHTPSSFHFVTYLCVSLVQEAPEIPDLWPLWKYETSSPAYSEETIHPSCSTTTTTTTAPISCTSKGIMKDFSRVLHSTGIVPRWKNELRQEGKFTTHKSVSFRKSTRCVLACWVSHTLTFKRLIMYNYP